MVMVDHETGEGCPGWDAHDCNLCDCARCRCKLFTPTGGTIEEDEAEDVAPWELKPKATGSMAGGGTQKDAPAVEWTADEDEPQEGEAAPRTQSFEVMCLGCDRNLITRDPIGGDCPDCDRLDSLVVKACGGQVWPFDWARWFARYGAEGTLLQGGEPCVLCRKPIADGAEIVKTLSHNLMAHTFCVEEELGYAGVLLRHGEIRYVPEVTEGDDPPMCCLCSRTVDVGEQAYFNAGHAAHAQCVVGVPPAAPVRLPDDRDPCEWNPDEDRESRTGDPFHGQAELVVGSGSDSARLCCECRELPRWKRKRKAVPIRTEEVAHAGDDQGKTA